MVIPKPTWAEAGCTARAAAMTPAAAKEARESNLLIFMFVFLYRDKTRSVGQKLLDENLDNVSGEAGAGHQERVEGDVFEKGEFEPEREDLAQVDGVAAVTAAGAKAGQGIVGDRGEFDAGGDERGVELDDGAELQLEAKFHRGRGRGFALEHPAAAVGKGGRKGGQQRGAFGVAVALELEEAEPGVVQLGQSRGGEGSWVWRHLSGSPWVLSDVSVG